MNKRNQRMYGSKKKLKITEINQKRLWKILKK